MPYYSFAWDAYAEAHLAEHDVTPDGFEAILDRPFREGISRKSGMPIAFGWAGDGRYLACVYEIVDDVIRPITANKVGSSRNSVGSLT